MRLTLAPVQFRITVITPMAMGSLQKSHFTTEKLPQSRKVAAWRDSIGTLFDVSTNPGQPDHRFDASVVSFLLGGQLMLSRCETHAQHFKRNGLKLANDGLDHYMIQTHISGSQQLQRGSKQSDTLVGDILVIDLAEQHDAITTDFDNLTLIVPRPLLSPLLNAPDSQSARVLKGSQPLTRLAVNYMKDLFSVLATCEPAHVPQVIEPTLMMMAATLNGSTEGQEKGPGALAFGLLTRAKMEIEKQLHQPIAMDAMCKQMGCSRSTLYRLFEPLGGVRGYVQDRRLRRSAAALLSPQQRGTRICDIAHNHGFSSEAHYSRAFRKRYGVTPSEARVMPDLLQVASSSVCAQEVGDREYEYWLSHGLRL